MTTPSTSPDLLADATILQPRLTSWRRTLHRYPELSYTERKTSALVRSVLTDLGIRFEAGVAKTGVIGYIEGDQQGPTVGLRADMDALPIHEENGTDFDSERPGLMHACGHDGHTAMLLGAATLLKSRADRGELPGSVRLLFQPSEEAWDDEGKSGGRRMVEEGALAGIDAVFGLHVDSEIEVGGAATRVGKYLAAVDSFELTVRADGAHATEPHKSADPIALAGLLINAIHQVVSRHRDPVDPAILTIGTIDAGTATNIIPDSLVLTGTLRSFTDATRQRLQHELRRACTLVEAFGARFELEIEEGYPVTVNDAAATEVAFGVMEGLFGSGKAREGAWMLGSEDFSYMAQAAPGCFVMLGVRDPDWDREYPVHTSTFRMREDAMPYGSALLAGSALAWLEGKRG